MKTTNPDNLKHRVNSKQREDQMARITGTTAQKAHTKRRAIQRITTQRGTDRD